MSVALARYAAVKGSLVVLVMVPGNTVLAELSLVSWWTVATFDPSGGFTGVAPHGRGHVDVVEEANALRSVRTPDFDGRDVGQNGHEITGFHGRVPTKTGILMEAESVLLHLQL